MIELGGPCPEHPLDIVAARREPLPLKLACVPQGVRKALSPSLVEIADRHLFSLRTDEMEQIALTSGDKKLELVRAGTGWHMRLPTEGNVDNDVGQDLARSLQDLTGELVPLVEAPHAAEPPRATATITKVEGGDEPTGVETVLMASAAAGFDYVKRDLDGAWLKVPHEAAGALIPSSVSLRSRKIVDVPVAQKWSASPSTAPTVHQVLRRSPSGGWTLEEPRGFAVDPGLAADIAEAFGQLRAERWVPEGDDGSFGLSSPRAWYQLDREGGAFASRWGRPRQGGPSRGVSICGGVRRVERQFACAKHVGHRSIVFCSRPRTRAASRPDPRYAAPRARVAHGR